MDNIPYFSIIVPAFKAEKTIKRCIDSIINQSYKDYELIIIDDGSTDNTAEIVAEYGDKVRYIRYEHKGICQLRNALLDEAKGEWLLFLDADDYLATDFIEQSFRDISTGDESLAIVYPDRTYFGANEFNVVSEEFSIEKMKHRNIIVMCSLVRLSAARRIGFDLAFAEGLEDYDFFLGLINAGYKAKAQHKSHVFCRVHKRSRTAAIHKDIYRSNRLMRQIVEKYSSLFSKKEARDVLDYYNVPIAMRLHLMQLWNDKYVFIMVLYAIKYFIICLVHPWWIVGEIRRIKFLNK
jgi:glycosyltransferase involved in cell wall biosynthesis